MSVFRFVANVGRDVERGDGNAVCAITDHIGTRRVPEPSCTTMRVPVVMAGETPIDVAAATTFDPDPAAHTRRWAVDRADSAI